MNKFINFGPWSIYVGKMPGPGWSLTRSATRVRVFWRVYRKSKGQTPATLAKFLTHRR